MFETEIFGVQDPERGTLGFVSVMGSGGEFPAVSIYLGERAIFDFFDVSRNPESAWYRLLEVPQLQMSFVDRADLEPSELATIRQLGLRFRGSGNWPVFRAFRPGYLPWFLTNTDADTLLHVLGQLIHLVPRIRADRGIVSPPDPDRVLMRIPEAGTDGWKWREEYRRIEQPPLELRTTAVPDADVETLKALPRLEEAVEVDVFLIPTPVGMPGEPRYFPYVLFLVGAESGLVHGMQMLRVETTLEDLYGTLPGTVFTVLTKARFCPSTILARSEAVIEVLKTLGRQLAAPVVPVGDLPKLDEARESLLEEMRRRDP